MNKIITGVWSVIKQTIAALSGEAKKVMPIVIHTMENIKNYEDKGKWQDALTEVIPAEAPELLRLHLRKLIPMLLKDLHLTDNCTGNQNEIVKCGFRTLAQSSDNAKDILFHGIVSKLLELTSRGKLPWKDVIGVAEFLYQTIFKKQQAGAL
jgi:hypothetical protein